MGQKNKKKINLPSATLLALGKEAYAALGKEFKKIKKILCRAPNGGALGKG